MKANPLTVLSRVFESNGEEYTFELRRNTAKSWDRKERDKLGRAYVWKNDSDEQDRLKEVIQEEADRVESGTHANDGENTIYTRRGDFPTIDKAWDKLNRQIVKELRQVLEDGLEAVDGGLVQASKNPVCEEYSPFYKGSAPNIKTFSRKAGCGCGCSPGFIMNELRGYEIFVSPLKEV